MAETMITTIDNPFNPHTEFDEWLNFDRSKGYNTLEYLDRICKTSHDISPADQDVAINNAIDEIIEMNLGGIYKKVTA